MNSYFMKQMALKSIIHGKYAYFMEISCHFYGNYVYFTEISYHLWKICVTGASAEGCDFWDFQGLSGSVGVGRGLTGSDGEHGTGTFSGPICAPEWERSELWK